MLNTDPYYYHTNIAYSKLDFLKNFVNDCALWQWKPWFYVDAKHFEPEVYSVLVDDQFIHALDQNFGGQLYIYKIPARTFYPWHIDHAGAGRWSFNMVYEEYNCASIFEIGLEQNYLSKLIELKYVPGSWTIFNTQKRHSVVNVDSCDRILVTYRCPTSVAKYQEVLTWFKNYQAQA